MKKHILLLFVGSFVYCQAPSIAWQKDFGGVKNEIPSTIIKTPDGGFLTCGYSPSTPTVPNGDITVPYTNASNIWVFKINEFGTIIWQKNIGCNIISQYSKMILTADGGFMLGCTSSSPISGDKTENAIQGSPDYWIIKLDSLGNIQWDNTLGGSWNDYFQSMIQTPDGGYLIGGISNSNISGDKTQNHMNFPFSNGNEDYWVIKLDSQGNTLWDKTIGGFAHDELNSMCLANDGGYILAGTTSSGADGLKTEFLRGWDDFWLLKIDFEGNIVWQKSYGVTDSDQLRNIIRTKNNDGYIVTGDSNSNASYEKTNNSKGSLDFWVIKIDNFGSVTWDKTYGGGLDEFSPSICEGSNGEMLISGWSSSNISGDKTENSRGLSDTWLVKINNSGTILWDKTYGGFDRDGTFGLDYVNADNSFIVGNYSASSISGDKTVLNKREGDFWIIKLNGENLSIIKNSFFDSTTIYPNPTKNFLNIKFSHAVEQVSKIEISNMLGQIMNIDTIVDIPNSELIKLNLLNLEAGVYNLTLKTNEGNWQCKFVKE